MSGRCHPRGVMMRDCSKTRAGFDRVLMAVAATFLTVSATSALAQADPARSSAAELAIDAAVPRPEPANVPPPTVNDFKPDATASIPDAAKVTEKPAETKPSDLATAPAVDATKDAAAKDALPRTTLPRTTSPRLTLATLTRPRRTRPRLTLPRLTPPRPTP